MKLRGTLPMPYHTRLRSYANRQIVSWQLSEVVFTEVHLRLNQELPADPTSQLVRTRSPFDGMTYSFGLIDPENRLCEHRFLFHIFYGQDEETLWVARGAYLRSVNF